MAAGEAANSTTEFADRAPGRRSCRPRIADISMACGGVPRQERSGSRRRSYEELLLPGKRAVE